MKKLAVKKERILKNSKAKLSAVLIALAVFLPSCNNSKEVEVEVDVEPETISDILTPNDTLTLPTKKNRETKKITEIISKTEEKKEEEKLEESSLEEEVTNIIEEINQEIASTSNKIQKPTLETIANPILGTNNHKVPMFSTNQENKEDDSKEQNENKEINEIQENNLGENNQEENKKPEENKQELEELKPESEETNQTETPAEEELNQNEEIGKNPTIPDENNTKPSNENNKDNNLDNNKHNQNTNGSNQGNNNQENNNQENFFKPVHTHRYEKIENIFTINNDGTHTLTVYENCSCGKKRFVETKTPENCNITYEKQNDTYYEICDICNRHDVHNHSFKELENDQENDWCVCGESKKKDHVHSFTAGTTSKFDRNDNKTHTEIVYDLCSCGEKQFKEEKTPENCNITYEKQGNTYYEDCSICNRHDNHDHSYTSESQTFYTPEDENHHKEEIYNKCVCGEIGTLKSQVTNVSCTANSETNKCICGNEILEEHIHKYDTLSRERYEIDGDNHIKYVYYYCQECYEKYGIKEETLIEKTTSAHNFVEGTPGAPRSLRNGTHAIITPRTCACGKTDNKIEYENCSVYDTRNGYNYCKCNANLGAVVDQTNINNPEEETLDGISNLENINNTTEIGNNQEEQNNFTENNNNQEEQNSTNTNNNNDDNNNNNTGTEKENKETIISESTTETPTIETVERVELEFPETNIEPMFIEVPIESSQMEEQNYYSEPLVRKRWR